MKKQEIEKAINHLTMLRKLDSVEKKSIYDTAISALTQQINNGWIPVSSERLPSENDTDAERDFSVLAIHKADNRKVYHWRSVAENPFDFTYWMPISKTPETFEITERRKQIPNVNGHTTNQTIPGGGLYINPHL